MPGEEPVATPHEREEQIRRLVRAYEQQLRQALPSGPQTLEQIERNADEIGQAVKQRIQKEVSETQGTGYTGRVLACACGKPARYVADYTRCVVTLHGPLPLSRAYYHCGVCKQGFCPLDSVLQLGASQCSIPAQALICRFAAFLPFAAAARELRVVCGLDVSASTVRRVAVAVGGQMQQAWTQHDPRHDLPAQEEAPARPKQLHLTCDGVMLHIEGVWLRVSGAKPRSARPTTKRRVAGWRKPPTTPRCASPRFLASVCIGWRNSTEPTTAAKWP